MRFARTFLKTVFVAIAAAATLAACGGGGGGSAAEQQGTLRVSLTDAPSCGFNQVYVTVDRVRVHRSADASENASGWTDIALTRPEKIDLLSLTNGVLREIGTTPLPAGQYQQVRLVLVPNRGGALANSVVPTPPQGETEQELALETPSGVQSGIKLVNGFTVEPNRLSDLILDFDACRSIVRRGNGTYGLKPVIRVKQAVNVAAIVGVAAPGVTVSAQKGGAVESATVPNANGEFTLAYLDPAKSPYDVVFTAPNSVTAVITGVPASTTAITRVSTSSAPIILGPSAMRSVSGALGPEGARDDGEVRALQAVNGVPGVEVAATNVEPNSGNYALSLPIAAPQRASYSTTLPLSFSAVVPAAAQYTGSASASGFQTATFGVNLSASSVTQNIMLVP
jgi:hypothetical protein